MDSLKLPEATPDIDLYLVQLWIELTFSFIKHSKEVFVFPETMWAKTLFPLFIICLSSLSNTKGSDNTAESFWPVAQSIWFQMDLWRKPFQGFGDLV